MSFVAAEGKESDDLLFKSKCELNVTLFCPFRPFFVNI
jgi:hypothetical protein